MSTKHRLVALLGAGLTVVALTAASVGSASADDVLRIQIRDDCDPATFNLDPPKGAGPDVCIGEGDTTFSAFIGELIATQTVKRWAFKPNQAEVKAGQMVAATNRGGERHTFTCVTAFGGGVVPPLNEILGLTKTPAVPCNFTNIADAFVATVVPQGGSSKPVSVGSSGTVMFQCLIHPWMRTTLRVTGD